jgi:hypothetical protein
MYQRDYSYVFFDFSFVTKVPFHICNLLRTNVFDRKKIDVDVLE